MHLENLYGVLLFNHQNQGYNSAVPTNPWLLKCAQDPLMFYTALIRAPKYSYTALYILCTRFTEITSVLKYLGYNPKFSCNCRYEK